MLQRKAGIEIPSDYVKESLDGYAYIAMTYVRIEQTSDAHFDPEVMRKLVDLHVPDQHESGMVNVPPHCVNCGEGWNKQRVPCKTLLLLGEALEVEWDWSYVHTRWDEKRDE